MILGFGGQAPPLSNYQMTPCEDRPAPFPTYLLVYDCRMGEEYFQEIGEDVPLDLEELVAAWVKGQFGEEAEVDLPMCDHGDYEASIKTDSNSPDSVVSWEFGSFYLK